MVYGLGWPAFAISASPVVLHRERIPRKGPFLLASNHLSPYDVPLLIKETPRVLDFVSIEEVFRNPFVAWFYGNMGAFPLNRGKVDTATTRTILDRLGRGRVVALFPEGRIRTGSDSVIHGGNMKPGVLRLARIANVPILPVVVLGSAAYHRLASWMPGRNVLYGVNYGEPIVIQSGSQDLVELEDGLRAAYVSLNAELSETMRARR